MIYVTGNIHADIKRFSDHKIKKLKKSDTLIICGDFGFIWRGNKAENKILKKIGKHKYTVLFVDGNHENFNLLKNYPEEEFGENVANHISGNLYHLKRGQVYTIENKKIFTFGGGESSDKEFRVESETWWSEELPNIEEIKSGVTSLKKAQHSVDYIITHEPPTHIKALFDQPFNNITFLNTFFDDVSKRISFKKWFFGSTHIDKQLTRKYHSIFLDVIPIDENSVL